MKNKTALITEYLCGLRVIFELFKKSSPALTFSFGLLIAMSEGPFFPWLNFLGVGLFSLTPALARRFL